MFVTTPLEHQSEMILQTYRTNRSSITVYSALIKQQKEPVKQKAFLQR